MPRWHLHLQVVLVLSCLLLRVVLYLLIDWRIFMSKLMETDLGIKGISQ